MIEAVRFNTVVVSVEFAARGDLWRFMPGADKLNEETYRQRSQNTICPNDLWARTGLAISANLLLNALLRQDAKAPEARPARR